jgi:hypothetical protein
VFRSYRTNVTFLGFLTRAAQRVGGKKKKEKDAEAALGGLQEQGHHEFCGPRKPFDDLAILLGNGSLALFITVSVQHTEFFRHTCVENTQQG